MRNEQGVIISLIVFIVLTLAFGVGTYFGAKGYQEQKAALETARSEYKNAKAERDSLAADLNNFKTRLGYGYGTAKEILEGQDGSETRKVNLTDESGAPVHYNGMADDLAAALGEASRDLTFKDGVAKLTAEIAAVNQQIADSVQERDANVAAAHTQIGNSVQENQRFTASVVKSMDTVKDELATASDNYTKLTGDFNAQTKEFDITKRDARESILAAREATEKERKAADNFAEINMDLSRRIDLLTNADFEEADAVVLSTDQVGRIVRLNVGKVDGVRPLTKFNVFSKNVLEKGGVKAKASVQVTHSIEENVCHARILSDDPNNPIEPGDFVFTPLWRPGDIFRYALDYRLDINGDGVSDLGEIYNIIEISGGEVAAYIDDDGAVNGKITPDLYRLIVPDESIADRIAGAGDLSAEDKAKLLEDQAAFVASAKENGVRTMRLSDLLVQIGYKRTEALDRFGEERAAGEAQAAASKTSVGNTSVIPVYTRTTGEIIPGSILPLHEDGAAEQAKKSNVQFRKRTPKE